MDKELIAMCDCPEIQDCFKDSNGQYKKVQRDLWGGTNIPGTDRLIALPSVSWLLREIEGDLELTRFNGKWNAGMCLHGGNWSSVCPPQDSPNKALLHVLMWQKGFEWKQGEAEWLWVRR